MSKWTTSLELLRLGLRRTSFGLAVQDENLHVMSLQQAERDGNFFRLVSIFVRPKDRPSRRNLQGYPTHKWVVIKVGK